MKKIIVVVYLILINAVTSAQNTPYTYFLNDSILDENIYSSVLDKNGNVILCGYISDSVSCDGGHLSAVGLLMKISPQGDTIMRTYHFPEQEIWFQNISIMPDGNFLIIGQKCFRFLQDSSKIILIKIDTNFQMVWKKEHNYNRHVGFAISPVYFKNTFYAFGGVNSSSSTEDVLVIKCNLNGDTLKTRVYIDSIADQYPESVIIKPDSSGFYVFGRNFLHQFPLITHYGHVMEIDTNLNLDTLYGMNPKYLLMHLNVKQLDENQWIMGAVTIKSLGARDNLALYKVNSHTLDTTACLYFYKNDTISQTAYMKALDFYDPDYIYFSGYYELPNAPFITGPTWPVMICVDSQLNIRFIKYFYDGINYNVVPTLQPTADKGVFMFISRYDLNATCQNDMYIIKMDSLGNVLGLPEHSKFKAYDNLIYPNPGSEALQLMLAPQVSRLIHKNVKLYFTIFDMQGRIVLQIPVVQENLTIPTAHWAKGTYIYSITGSNGYKETGKWIKQ